MKNYILEIEIRENMAYAKLPREVQNVSICYVTTNKNPNQRPTYESRLEIGHDFQIRNGYIISRKIDVIGDNYILVQSEESSGKKCKTCRKDNQSGSFCSSCGSFLF